MLQPSVVLLVCTATLGNLLLNASLLAADHILKEWKKKTKNDAATRLAGVLHAVSTLKALCNVKLFMLCTTLHIIASIMHNIFNFKAAPNTY